MLTIRHTRMSDLPQVIRIFTAARNFMRSCGNFNQWAGTYPDENAVQNDMANDRSYVVVDGDDIVATFCLLRTPEPTYAVIDGAWPDDLPYVTIHRIASDGTRHGIFNLAVNFAAGICSRVRIDTHHDNAPMRNALKSAGFVECGIIYLTDGAERIAYHKSFDTKNTLST